MDWQEFVISTLESFVASLPQLLVVATTVLYYLKKMRETTDLFPSKLLSTEKTLASSFDQAINYSNVALEGMGKALNQYQNELNQTRNQVNMVVQQNKVLMETVITLLGQNPEQIKLGTASTLTKRIDMVLKELEQNPEQLFTDLSALEKDLLELIKVIGLENFDTIAGKIGYERKEL